MELNLGKEQVEEILDKVKHMVDSSNERKKKEKELESEYSEKIGKILAEYMEKDEGDACFFSSAVGLSLTYAIENREPLATAKSWLYMCEQIREKGFDQAESLVNKAMKKQEKDDSK